jgi:membrane-associated phospholipid phosphatase
MKMNKITSLLIFLMIFHPFLSEGNNFLLEDSESEISNSFSFSKNKFSLSFHNDSIHQLNFRYAHERKGLKPYLAPALLISGGTALHFMTDFKESVRDFTQENFAYHGHVDDYIQYAPLAAVYALNAAGIKGKNNFGNRTAIVAKSFILNGIFVDRLKSWTGVTRPDGGIRSFPSGHTATAFSLAHFMHHEYGDLSPWFSVGAYSTATAVGIMRVAKNAHWISDVIVGAGVGILATELVYLTHQYKWDNEHLKRFDIFPFQLGNQKGLTLVYNF